MQQVNYYLLTILSCGCSAQVKIDCHLSSFTITLKQGQDTMQLISLIVFRTDTWKRMVIRDIIIFLISGAASVGRIQEDTPLMRFQKGSSMITAIRQYSESSSVQSFLTYLLEHRPSEDMLDEQLEVLTPWSKEVQNVCKN